MKKEYSQQDINLFFKEFKDLPGSFGIEKVHQLLNNPDAKATHTVNFHFKHLKFIIMTSAFIIGVTIFSLWVTPKEKKQRDKITEPVLVQNISSFSIDNEESKAINDTNKVSLVNEKVSQKAKIHEEQENKYLKAPTNRNDSTFKEEISTNNGCQWPDDTLIDKKSLYVYLTNEELERLGVHVVHPSGSKYYISSPQNSYYYQVNTDSIADEMTPFAFEALTDTLCTSHRWGSPFYNMVDKLVPIIPQEFDNKNLIFWFHPNICWPEYNSDSIFKVLPDKYRHLNKSFNNLICLKQKYPDKIFVNHWDINRNTILGEINSLHLNKSELESLGIQFQRNTISMKDTNGFIYYLDSTNFNTKIPKGFPQLFPTLITDIKGLELLKFGSFMEEDYIRNDKNNYNLLIPVFFPLSEYIDNKDYEMIFWYYPTDDFIAALPDRIRTKLSLELKSLKDTSVKNTTSCTYFEVCKSTLQLDNFKLYPNPAKYSATIEFDVSEEVNGSVSIVNIAGARLKKLTPNTTFLTGRNSFTLDLSGITPGIYLISINTNKGFKTQRIIISR